VIWARVMYGAFRGLTEIPLTVRDAAVAVPGSCIGELDLPVCIALVWAASPIPVIVRFRRDADFVVSGRGPGVARRGDSTRNAVPVSSPEEGCVADPIAGF